MLPPALPYIGRSLGISDNSQLALIYASSALTIALGSLFWGPLAEIYGRVIIIHVASLCIIALNILSGFAQTQLQLTAFRFLSGFCIPALMISAGGLISDMF